MELLAAGKDVVTANKALLAQHGAEVFDAARRHGRAVAFEASVAGGIPIIAAIAQNLAANQILAIQGILNGTSNFILTSMTEGNQGYAEALAEAQRRGYAEADPTLDVNGADAAHKLAILAHIAFGVPVPLAAIDAAASPKWTRSTSALPANWVTSSSYSPRRFCRTISWRYTSRQSCCGERRRWRRCRGAYNAIYVVGDAVGDALFYGQARGKCRRPAP